jgi:hypothetical protein
VSKKVVVPYNGMRSRTREAVVDFLKSTGRGYSSDVACSESLFLLPERIHNIANVYL